jgi:hypothetical protein
MWRRIFGQMFIDVSEEHIVRIEEWAKHLATKKQAGKQYFILKIETVLSSEMSVDFYPASRHHIPEDSTFHSHRCENLKPITPSLTLLRTWVLKDPPQMSQSLGIEPRTLWENPECDRLIYGAAPVRE